VTARQTPRQSRSAITCCILGTKEKVATTKIETAVVSTSSRKKDMEHIYTCSVLPPSNPMAEPPLVALLKKHPCPHILKETMLAKK
jgi:hypothetical protein